MSEQDALDQVEHELENRETVVDVEQVNGHVIALVAEDCPQNPRDSMDSLWHIAYCERTWGVGDSYADKADQWLLPIMREYGIDQARVELLADESWQQTPKAHMVLPLHYIDYGSNGARLMLDTTPTAKDWEEANGLAWVTRPELLESYQLTHRVSAKAKAAALRNLQAEVSYFDAWLSGDVYGYVVIDPHNEMVDSCWGFYGDQDRAYALAQARQSANAQPPDEPPFPLTA